MGRPAPARGRLRRTLEETFGFFTLRPGQDEVIRAVMEGHDAVTIMPTGAGKSLCYQLPALHLAGTTVVVAPLISLMKDQVEHLERLGIDVALVNSTLSAAERAEVLDDIENAQCEFVFATPEQLAQPAFTESLRENAVDVFVVDEAHCISEWGHDFRPDYLALRTAIEALGRPPVLAMTATATPRVIDDIVARLGLADPRIINTGIFRSNLHLEAHACEGEGDKNERLLRLLAEVDGTGIVYVATIRHCEAVTELLQGQGIAAARYHGRLSTRERHATQDRFMAGELKTIVATNAFGMGIDKQDIRFVFHYDLPGSLEAYYQEAGRSGRDGEPARCVLLHHPADRRTQLYMLRGRYPGREHFHALRDALHGFGNRRPGRTELLAAADARGQRKLAVALAGLAERKFVADAGEGYFVPDPGALGEAEIDRLAASYERRRQHDRERLDQMVVYAQTARCRWRVILDYFADPLAMEACGVCDNCERARARARAEAATPPPPSRRPPAG